MNEPEISNSQFHDTAPAKFIILSVVTLGLYELYWFYRCWKYVRIAEQSTIWPFWRAFFAPLWIYPLFSRIYASPNHVLGTTIFLSYFILQGLRRLPDPYWLMSMLTFVPILPLVVGINRLNRDDQEVDECETYWRFGWVHWLVSILGFPVAVFTIVSSFNLIPSTQVLPGKMLTRWDLDYFKELGIHEDGETVLYFYSAAMFSKKNDGNFFTDRRVVSYWVENGETFVESAEYDAIANIAIGYSDSVMEDTQIDIRRDDGTEFQLYISNEMKKDKEFSERLMEIWKESELENDEPSKQ